MKNRIQDAEQAVIQSFTNASGGALVSGDGYWAGTIFGVLQGDVANAAVGVMHTAGVFELTKANGVSFAVGDDVGWDAANKRVAVGQFGGRIGRCWKAAANGDLTLQVKLENTGERRFAYVAAPSAGQDAANSADIDTGFGAVPRRFDAYLYVTATGVKRPITTTTALPGTPGTVRAAEANMATTDTLVVTAVA